jgi:hypothetical protein
VKVVAMIQPRLRPRASLLLRGTLGWWGAPGILWPAAPVVNAQGSRASSAAQDDPRAALADLAANGTREKLDSRAKKHRAQYDFG